MNPDPYIAPGVMPDDLLTRLRVDFQHLGARDTYSDSVVNALISAQINALREERKLSQEELAQLIGTKQSGISRLERADYSSWTIETLRKLARAFGVRLRISFDEFGTLLPDIGNFSKKRLTPRKFEEDPVFNPSEEQAQQPEPAGAASRHKGGERGAEGDSMNPNPYIAPEVMPEHFIRRRIIGPNEFRHVAYGWTPCCTGWEFSPPACPDGNDPDGWESFIVAQLFSLPTSVLAVDFGCHWEDNHRCWAPAFTVVNTIEEAMDWIEARLFSLGCLRGLAVGTANVTT
jgi:transcriptional regulator with XRE-family HTH domain